jgi:hypothetical protein
MSIVEYFKFCLEEGYWPAVPEHDAYAVPVIGDEI